MPTPMDNSLFRNLYCFLAGSSGNSARCSGVEGILPASLAWLAYLITGLAIVLLLVNALLLGTMVYTWFERRALGRFQARLGPNRWGPFGLLQPIADAIKLITKEDVVPAVADRWVFNLAPIIFILPVLLVWAVIPFGKNTFLADLNIAILFVIAVSTVGTLGILMAGWASNNKYALFGAARGVAQLISYEIPMVLSIVGILLLAGSLSLVQIVEAQRIPFILLQPLGFFIFLMGASAEMNRTPFDQIEADSEIVAGYHIEYSGMKWGIFQLAEFAAVLGSSAIASTLFLKGWEGPFLPSHVWFLLKTFLLAFVFIWARATLPRLRIDQVMSFAWKFLFPLAMFNLSVTALEVLIWENPTTTQLWALVAINWALALGSIIVMARVLGHTPPKRLAPREAPFPYAAEVR